MGIKIIGTGSYAPPRILSNADLEKMVDTTDEWISTRTGIKERHIAAPEVATSDLALEAAKQALDAAGLKPEDLDVISVASISSDKVFPSTACFLQRKLGAKNAFCYDLQAACSGLLYSLETAFWMLKGGKYKNFLVVGAEKLSSIVDWQDRSTCVLFGDGASAMVLQKTGRGVQDCIVASRLCSDGNYTEILHVPAGGSAQPTSHETVEQRLHYLKMGGQEVFKLAVNGMVSASKEVLEKAGIAASDVAWVIPHQANMRILKAVASRLDLPEERVYVNVDRYGNTSAASIGIAVDELVRGGKIKHGDLVLLTAFGGGLTWGAMLLRW
ncbi:MAG: 3-oxoacyl-ACP synthase [Lentisphaerae bacterium GWF2_52_8]|nr:MAG: 3-oxoacyl-ACP synthase [Lentisphaerae bacterium GWF2_52_8]